MVGTTKTNDMKTIRVNTKPSKNQEVVLNDFTVNGTLFTDTEFLFDEDGKTIYAVCEDGYVKITNVSCQAIDAEMHFQRPKKARSIYDDYDILKSWNRKEWTNQHCN